jgi:hypothetical protein
MMRFEKENTLRRGDSSFWFLARMRLGNSVEVVELSDSG